MKQRVTIDSVDAEVLLSDIYYRVGLGVDER
jgi:hypothetical protein